MFVVSSLPFVFLWSTFRCLHRFSVTDSAVGFFHFPFYYKLRRRNTIDRPLLGSGKKKKEGSDYWYEKKKKKLAVHYIHSSFKKKKDKSLYPEGQQKNDSVMSVSMCRPLFFFRFALLWALWTANTVFVSGCHWKGRERREVLSLFFFVHRFNEEAP